MADDPRKNVEKTPRQMPKGKPFAPGNPGRPKGSRHKLGQAFIEALHADFELHGESVIETVRLEKPDQYMKVVASLLPKEFKIETTSDLTDEQLDARIRQLADIIQIGTGVAAGGSEEAEGPQTAH